MSDIADKVGLGWAPDYMVEYGVQNGEAGVMAGFLMNMC